MIKNSPMNYLTRSRLVTRSKSGRAPEKAVRERPDLWSKAFDACMDPGGYIDLREVEKAYQRMLEEAKAS